MIISQTPFRISLFGGGSDYPTWYREHGGAVLGFALNKYCYISLRYLPPFFEHHYRIVYSKIELVNRIDEIVHPAVRHILLEMGEETGLEIHHDGDLPARSGLGSSSSFSVGLLNALYAKRNKTTDKMALAKEAIRIEQDVIGENVGSQDQVWAAHGGLNKVLFHTTDEIDVNPIYMDPTRIDELTDNLMLFFTGVSRFATDIAGKKIANLSAREDHIRRMTELVDEAVGLLSDPKRPLSGLGELLHESWSLKRELSEGVTTPRMDEIYEAAIQAGAGGGKVLGAGGGGFILFYAEPENQRAVRERLKDLVYVPVGIDREGSRIIYRGGNGW